MEKGTNQSPVWGLKNQLAKIEQNDPRSSSQAMISNHNQDKQNPQAMSKMRRMTLERLSQKIQQVYQQGTTKRLRPILEMILYHYMIISQVHSSERAYQSARQSFDFGYLHPKSSIIIDSVLRIIG